MVNLLDMSDVCGINTATSLKILVWKEDWKLYCHISTLIKIADLRSGIIATYAHDWSQG